MSALKPPRLSPGSGAHRLSYAALVSWAHSRVRDVSWKTVVVVVLTIAAVTALGLALAQVGFGELLDALANASPGVLLLAFLASQLRFVAFTVALRGAMGRPLSWWRTTQLQYATQLFALATPGDSARLVMSVTYAEKSGADRDEAIGKAPLATVTGWVIDVLVLIVAGIAVGTGAHGSSFATELGDAWPLVAAMAGVLIAAVLVIAFVPVVRRRVVPPLVATLTETWRSLRSPRQVAEIFGGGLVERLAFAASMLLIVDSLGSGITFWEALLVSGGAVAAGGIIPTPGGIGVSGGATAALLVVVGVPEAVAIAAALLVRAFNIYLPAIYGIEALRELRRAKLL